MSTNTTDGNLVSQEIEELEDRLDAALLKLARVEQTNDEAIPFAVVQLLSNGGVPTRIWREYRGLSQEELARAARVPAELVVQVEVGKEDVPLRSMHALARTLSVDLDDLVPWTTDGD
ncbi:MAG TPA: helix-turn-helix transcriptional regulator [Acetobacteraceae bacterium]|nr:helix-turn-helix transcriptional regulator [Acetobacteraceae bacterium]